MPLTTEGDRLISAQRINQKEEIPRPIEKEATPKWTFAGETVRVTKIEIWGDFPGVTRGGTGAKKIGRLGYSHFWMIHY